ncbi:D-2-hydroxyacid dehydrogenase [Pseudaeromonas paramecii]|uniref:D-2-hydroxyacid dehydrogenase n=1 Tax=Pseudaeromonas paramecii TaxID=2138166 RepID=A0ABP8QB85_9GAMM
MTTRIVFLDRQSLPSHIRLRRPTFPHDWQDYPRTPPDEVVARLQGAQLAITNKVRLGAEQLAQLPDLRLIAVAATGTDHIDLTACRDRGIAVCNIQQYAVHSVAEHTLGLMLALARNLVPYQQDLLAGAWQASPQFCYLGHHPIHDLAGKTLGIIGGGSLGQAVAKLARAIGMQVLLAGRKGQAAGEGRTAFDEVLRQADVLSLHCPLTNETRGLIGATELGQMKDTAWLINTARGGIVDESALLEALNNGRLAGAACDVASQEPPPADSPLMQALRGGKLLLTPHVAWASDEAMQTLADQLIDNLEAFMAGEPLRRVD